MLDAPASPYDTKRPLKPQYKITLDPNCPFTFHPFLVELLFTFIVHTCREFRTHRNMSSIYWYDKGQRNNFPRLFLRWTSMGCSRECEFGAVLNLHQLSSSLYTSPCVNLLTVPRVFRTSCNFVTAHHTVYCVRKHLVH